MKTTIEIAEALLAEARSVAQREKTTLRALVEEGLRAVLLERKRSDAPVEFPDCRVGGQGLTPEFEAKGGMRRLREAAYPGFFDDEDDES